MFRKIVVIAILALFVIASPRLDQFVAVLPYNNITHQFYGENALWCQIIYRLVPIITTTCLIIPAVFLFMSRNNKLMFTRAKYFALVIYASIWIGPGIIVNNVFKDHWGRARPYQVLRDGRTFTPFWQPNFAHPTDNSFPSGHASVGFFMGVPLLAIRRRKSGIVLSLIGGTVIGLVRILEGGHYLSDVVFAGIMVYLVTAMVMWLSSYVFKNDKRNFCES